MGIFSKLKASLRDDWCGSCRTQMDETVRQLYMLPMTVGHYCPHKDAEYYKRSLRRVARRAEIPPGIYACEGIVYRCPECGQRVVKLLIYLPVRDRKKYEDAYLFEHGELDDLIFRQDAGM